MSATSATTDQLIGKLPWWMEQIMGGVGLSRTAASATPRPPTQTQALPPLPPPAPEPTTTLRITRPDTGATISVTFMSPEDTAAFIQDDADGYAAGLTDLDLIARQSANAKNYKDRAAQSATSVSLTPEQRDAVIQAALRADAFYMSCVQEPFNGRLIAAIPWVFAFTSDISYEGGLPHTRSNIIFLSTDILSTSKEDLAGTLVHEKVHIYQRQNPEAMSEWMGNKFYEPFSKVKERPSSSDVRSNPDMNDWFYAKCKEPSPISMPDSTAESHELRPRQAWILDNCEAMGAYYEGEAKDPEGNMVPSNPEKITDVRKGTDGPNEHPYEAMAYEVAGRFGKWVRGDGC